MSFFVDSLIFLLVFLFAYLVPGYFFLGIFKIKLSFFEHFIFSFLFSLVFVIFSSILLNLLHVPINKFSFAIFFLVFVGTMVSLQKKKFGRVVSFKDSFFGDKKCFIIFVTPLLALVVLYTMALSAQPLPYGTDLGHHSFWAKSIIITGELPDYGSNQFVIGESILLAIPFLISGLAFNSVYSLVLLFLVHIFGLLAVLALSFRIFKCHIFPALFSFFLITLPY